MNKGELTKAVAAESGLSQSDAGKAVDAVFEAIAGAVKSRQQVAIAGFGTFSAKTRNARTGRNPGIAHHDCSLCIAGTGRLLGRRLSSSELELKTGGPAELSQLELKRIARTIQELQGNERVFAGIDENELGLQSEPGDSPVGYLREEKHFLGADEP